MANLAQRQTKVRATRISTNVWAGVHHLSAACLAVVMFPILTGHVVAQMQLTPMGQFRHQPYGKFGAAEIVTHDGSSQRLYVANYAANTVDVISLRDPQRLRLLQRISLDHIGAGPTSVAVHRDLLAVAVLHSAKQFP